MPGKWNIGKMENWANAKIGLYDRLIEIKLN
jgi:hypothetical protein